MTEPSDWFARLFPEEAKLLDWSACVPLHAAEQEDRRTVRLAGTLKFTAVDTPVEVELDALRDGGGWDVAAIRLPEDAQWEYSAWHCPEQDVRASSDAKDRVPRIGLPARLNLYLLEAPHLYKDGYVSPLHREGVVDFEAVGTEELGEPLKDALRNV
ncbi:hypothetical protein [Streptomyces sp. NPDC059918]|uniref:hypothetical protein n=1 Tax=unclassified Streptomyces TaxID=2593676 RepID=UPI003662FC04